MYRDASAPSLPSGDGDNEKVGPIVRENYWSRGSSVFRRVRAGSFSATTSMPLPPKASRTANPSKLRFWWDWNELRGSRPRAPRFSHSVRIADLFCGCGGFGLGIVRAAEAVGV